ncbi:MAG: DNA-directed RNA polymerase subunit B [Candidatus ainarchaeum sp.]|nr:DNA-directed RNA polymerase subunit B [Candidatus ainarchaeum sp.]MDD3975954.1 DNA-directed RNA polymerase subunit B [Candidatus ainarchaeum sp.]
MNKCKVYINGSLIGFSNNPEKLKNDLIKKRRKGEIDAQINISYIKDINELYLSTDSGRLQRPLIILDNGKSKLTKEIYQEVKENKLHWNDLIEKGIIEYLDAEEEENALVAIDEKDITPDHTHLEISGTAIFSIISSMIPFINHNMAGKAIFGAKIFKQAVGLPSINYKNRFDTEMHVLYYPQKPLVTTRTEKMLGIDKRPMIQNCVVAIMPFEGYNMLDAMILNKGSIERGLGRSSYYRSYSAQENRYPSGQADEFIVPSENILGYRGEEAYVSLGIDGLANVESYVPNGGVIIGMSSPPRFVEEISDFGIVSEDRRESSVTARKHLDGFIDRVLVSQTVGGIKLAKVKVRTTLIPQIGDKFSSHHGQKGVIGAVVDEADMPFTASGIKPDFIMNPHSIPSRMTLGHLFETIAGKAGALLGDEIDGTAYYADKDYIFKLLKKYGFREDGKETFYNGTTGEKIDMPIFVGPISFKRLYHVVTNKIQARDGGSIQLLTRQPTEGKEKGGGLRFGEMEGDALVSHGAAMLLHEKLMDDADELEVYVCDDCGVLAIDDKIRNRRYCPICDGGNISKVKINYGFKLLLDELKSLGVYPKLNIGDKIE